MSNSTSDLNPNEVTKEVDSDGVPVAFKCTYHVATGKIQASTAKSISSYYDMLYPCNDNVQQGVDMIAANVLSNVAEYFNILPDGKACSIPYTALPLWLIGVSLKPADSTVQGFPCQKLVANPSAGQCCVVVHAPMNFWWTDFDPKETAMMKVLSNEFVSPQATVGTSYQVSYLGAYIDLTTETGQGTVNVPISKPESPPAASKNNTFTIVGVFVLAAMIVIFAGAIFVIWRRRRKWRTNRDVEAAISKSDLGFAEDGSDGPTLEVDVMSDDMPQSNIKGSYDFQDDSYPTSNSYTFDLSDEMKNKVFGTYGRANFGPTTMNVVAPYPMEEHSDSEADSWAQTDGTVGSLEDRLEEITAEI